MVLGVHVVFKPDGLDRAPIKDLLMLVTFPGKLGDEGRHCEKEARRKRVVWVGDLKTKTWNRRNALEINGREFREV